MRWIPGWIVVALACLGWGCSEDGVQTVPEALSVAPAELDFGMVPRGGKLQKSVVLRNEGRSRVSFKVEGIPPGISVEPQTGVVPAGGTIGIGVAFSPRATGELSATVRFRSLSSEAEAVLRLEGSVAERALDVTGPLDFEDVVVGKQKSLPLEIRSQVDTELEVEAILQGSDAFSLSRYRFQIQPRGTFILDVDFAPSARGPTTASLVLVPCQSCVEEKLAIHGRGLDYGLRVTPASLNFGKVAPGLSSTRAFEVTNVGDAPIFLGTPIWASGEPETFSLERVEIADPLPPGDSGLVHVTFSPNLYGYAEGSLRFVDADGLTLHEAMVYGVGGGSLLQVSPPSVDFGLQPVGRRVSKVVSLVNVGEPEAVLVEAIEVEGRDSDLIEVMAPPLPFDAGTQPIEIAIIGEVDQAGELVAEVVFHTDSPSQPVLGVPVRAEGVAPTECDLRVRPGEVRFGYVYISDRTPRSVELMNEGNETCFVWNVEVTGEHADFFSLEIDPLPFFLPGGESRSLTVHFDVENAPRYSALDAKVTVKGGAFEGPTIEVPIDAFATTSDLAKDRPNPVFEDTPVGRAKVVTLAFAFRHRFADLRFTEDSSPAFRLPPGAAAGVGGCSTEGCTELAEVQVVFMPTTEGVHRGTLEMFGTGWSSSLYVELEATAVPPCSDCDWPSPNCDIATEIDVGQDVVLSDEPGYSCRWIVYDPYDPSWTREVVGAHPLFTLDLDRPCNGAFYPHAVGSYLLGNLRIRSDGRAAFCRATVQASPPPGLWVETTSDPALEKMRLYVLGPDGGDPLQRDSWFDEDHSCGASPGQYHHPRNVTCSWGAGGTGDDPLFPFIGRYSLGFNILQPELLRPYHIGLYGKPRYWGVTVPVDLRVYCDRQLVSTQTIDAVYDHLFVAGTVQFDSTGQCSYVPDGETYFFHDRTP